MYCDAAQKGETSMNDFRQKLIAHDYIAQRVFDAYLDRLIPGLVSLAHVLSPEVIIIGGTISEEAFVIKAIKERFALKVLSFY